MQNEHATAAYQVVVNDEEQYSLWPGGRAIPEGWRAADMAGSREECLDFVRRVWIDMRPRSVRERMAKGDGA
jgi:MbtH protein